MKWLFFIIVLINAAFFGWAHMIKHNAAQVNDHVYAPPVSTSIRLLSEPANSEEKAAMVKAKQQSQEMEASLKKALTVAEANANDRSMLCPQLEVEKNADDAQITHALTKLKWKYSDKQVMGKRPKFWLYIEAPDTHAKAREIVNALHERSIDSFIITRGEMKNRISLGLYSSQEGADEARKRIESKLRYKLNIYRHLRTVSLHQINVEQPISDEDLEKLLSQFDLTKMMIKIEKNPC
ncbi:hypothetical protein MSP8886_04029 [Marinomonas spartinae]|uniref:Sporulation related domain protein n=1 Tax=Marinomonas spartinae TaxID=1792290 RepID=A0A1A8TSI4_9GAMM|nr:SPOR domain-containing protein [Marinomonas spartinae]SBS37219.1 hypothetical protein MSP8886_04029 [Marinomonas spartinae]